MTLAVPEASLVPSLVSQIVPYWAERAAERTAIVDGKRRWSYGELDRAIAAASTWLRDSGVRRGDRVMLVCENCAAAVAILFACTAVGAWPVIVNAKLSDREIDEIREHSTARRMIFTTAISRTARAHAERWSAVPIDLAGLGAVALSALNEETAPEPAAANPENDVAALIYTSGTTGRPKGVMLRHRALMFVAAATARARQLTPDDHVLAILPVSHILGLTGVLLGTLLSGGTVHLTSRFDPVSILGALKNDGISVMLGAPSLYALLAEYAGRKALVPIPGERLRLISSAGAPLDTATKAIAEHAFGRTLHNGYGITECGPSISLTPLDAPRGDCAVGRILPGIETRCVGPDGTEAAAGETGELLVRSPGLMNGYYRAEQETAAVIDRDGWFRTGDLARLEDGNLFIVGRSKDLIIRFGFNVYPAEVEGVLNGHPGVARSAVIGRPIDGSEEILAFVQPAPDAAITADELAAYAAERLVSYKRPSRIHLMAALPMSPAGKILKAELPVLSH